MINLALFLGNLASDKLLILAPCSVPFYVLSLCQAQLDESCGNKYNACHRCNWSGAGRTNFCTEHTFSLGFSVLEGLEVMNFYVTLLLHSPNLGDALKYGCSAEMRPLIGKGDCWTVCHRMLLGDPTKWRRLTYQARVGKFDLWLNHRWKRVIEPIFPSASSPLLFASYRLNTHIIKPQRIYFSQPSTLMNYPTPRM